MPAAPPLLATKLYLPPARADRVPRPRLLARLDQGLTRPVSLIAAPAGFGKTTLVSEWIAHQRAAAPAPVPQFAWLSLDDDDNDPRRFLQYLVAALRTADPRLGETAQAMLAEPEAPTPKAVLGTLTNDLCAGDALAPGPFVLVLDDYHLLTARPLQEALANWFDRLPPRLRVLLTSRVDPPLPLARWRVRNQLNELRAADLRFTPAEMTAFLSEVMGLTLTAADLATLEARTEGWIAGLQLAAIALQSAPQEPARIADFIQSFSGSHRYIVDYLVEEVLNRQPEPVRDFLLATSLLNRLCASLCDYLLDDDGLAIVRGPASSVLEELERANLFLIPLDGERRWYRYHALFGDVLRLRLQQLRPGWAPELHRRASQWFEQNGWAADAVRHALAADDPERVARLVEAASDDMLGRGEHTRLLMQTEALPDEVLARRPRLALARAHALMLVHQLAEAERWVLAAEAAAAAQASLLGWAQSLRANIAIDHYQLAEAVAHCQAALRLLPETAVRLRGETLLRLGLAYLRSDSIDAAGDAFAQAARLSEQAGNYSGAVLAQMDKGAVAYVRGRLRLALDCYEHSLRFAQDHRLEQMLSVGWLHSELADLWYEWNDLPRAAEHWRRCLAISDQSESLRLRAVGGAGVAGLRLAQGDLAGAAEAVAETARLVEAHNLSPRYSDPLFLAQFNLWLARGQLAEAAAWADGRGLHPDDNRLVLWERTYLGLARLWLAQQRWDDAQRLIERLERQLAEAGRQNNRPRLLALEALALDGVGRRAEALAALEQALALGEPEGFTRSFVDEGEPLRALLREWRRAAGAAPALAAYADRLLAAFEPSAPPAEPRRPPPAANQDLVEPLSGRELEILRLIADGYANPEIAARLVIAVATVKKHIHNIFGKLGAAHRAQAIARARELKLL